MALVGSKAPSWESTIYDNGEQKTLSSYELAGSWYVLFFGHLILQVFVTLK